MIWVELHARYYSFNPRARDGRDAPTIRNDPRATGFNPRARDGRDYGRELRRKRLLVSIHAPVMGATDFSQSASGWLRVSIHAPVMGATVL